MTFSSICFVHGLNGDAIQTWTSGPPEKCFWPQEILAPRFPSARIMTFGYNANLLKDTCEGRIAEFAESLLGELAGERGEAGVTIPSWVTQVVLLMLLCVGETSPSYFRVSQYGRYCRQTSKAPVVHESTAGVDSLQALSVAYSRPYYNTISKATNSIIFMATPHRGSNKAYWGEMGQRLFSSLTGTTSTSAVKELNAFSAVLEDINADFVNIANNYKFVSFFERQGTLGQGLVRSISGSIGFLCRLMLTRSSRNGLQSWNMETKCLDFR